MTGCASMQVRSYVAPGMDARQYRTYGWAPIEPQPTGDPRLDNNRFFQERVQAAVEKQLSNRGFEKTTSPELLIRYRATVKQEVYVSRPEPDDLWCEDCRPEVYDAGTLFIDLVDARTKRLLWRGWAEGSIDGVIDDQKWMEQRIDETVGRILKELPQRLSLS
jgi:hypothetical protein